MVHSRVPLAGEELEEHMLRVANERQDQLDEELEGMEQLDAMDLDGQDTMLHHVFDLMLEGVAGGRGSRKVMFPVPEPRLLADDYGLKFNPDKYRISDVNDMDGLGGPNGQGQEEVVEVPTKTVQDTVTLVPRLEVVALDYEGRQNQVGFSCCSEIVSQWFPVKLNCNDNGMDFNEFDFIIYRRHVSIILLVIEQTPCCKGIHILMESEQGAAEGPSRTIL